jgi:VIT1/CCC1 family predicted Fe2+/Mn2+ transporter
VGVRLGGCEPRCSVPTTASSRHRASCWVSPPTTHHIALCSRRGLLRSPRARWPWAMGEYVSVSSQRDVELADLRTERLEHRANPDAELDELTAIYRRRGLDPDLARRVAEQLTEADALGAHARDELGQHPLSTARPLQAAWVSAASFALGALVPFADVHPCAHDLSCRVDAVSALVALGTLGALGAQVGGAPRGKAAIRVFVGGGLAMGVTALVGHLAGSIGI